jgi:hypothetical protein
MRFQISIVVILLVCSIASCRIDPDAFEEDGRLAGSSTFTWGEGAASLRVSWEGEVTFSGDDSRIQSLGSDARFEIEQKDADGSRSLIVTPSSDGTLQYAYLKDDRPADFGQEGQSWLAEVLPRAIRETGVQASARVQQILEEKGVDAVVEEIAQIESGQSRGLYIEELIRSGEATEEVLLQLLPEIRQIRSGRDLVATLEKLIELYPESQSLTAALIETTKGTESSSARRRALRAIIEKRDLDSSAAIACAESASGIVSSSERAATLKAILDTAPPEKEVLLSVCEAASSIRSSFEKRTVIESVLEVENLPREVIVALCDVAAGIPSSSEREMAGIRVGEKLPGSDEELFESYLEMVSGLRSNSDKSAVLKRLLEREDLSPEVLKATRDFIEKELPESGTKTELLSKSK